MHIPCRPFLFSQENFHANDPEAVECTDRSLNVNDGLNLNVKQVYTQYSKGYYTGIYVDFNAIRSAHASLPSIIIATIRASLE